MNLDNYKKSFDTVIDYFSEDVTMIRTGRVSPALLEDFALSVYGGQMTIKEVASISIQEPRILVIKPWDKNLINDIANAIAKSDLGVNPTVQSDSIRVVFPSLTEERRKELIKNLHGKMEEARIKIRQLREEIWKEMKQLEEQKEITEDEKFRYKDELQKMVDEYNQKISDRGKEKEERLLQ